MGDVRPSSSERVVALLKGDMSGVDWANGNEGEQSASRKGCGKDCRTELVTQPQETAVMQQALIP